MFNQAVQFAPYYSGYRQDLALLYIDLATTRSDYSYLLKATKAAKESIQIDAYNIDGYMVLANSYLTGAESFGNRDDAKRAVRVLNQALRVKPQSALTHFFFARAFLRQGEEERAKAHLRRALEIESDYEGARKLLAELNRES